MDQACCVSWSRLCAAAPTQLITLLFIPNNGRDRINLSRAPSLLHQEGADWDPKASEWLQEVQFIIFNGEEQEVETWSWPLWFIHHLSRGRKEQVYLPVHTSGLQSLQLESYPFAIFGSSSTPPKYTCTLSEPLQGNNITREFAYLIISFWKKHHPIDLLSIINVSNYMLTCAV